MANTGQLGTEFSQLGGGIILGSPDSDSGTNQSAQAQTYIVGTYKVVAQSLAYIISFGSVKIAQAQAKLNSFNWQQFAQSEVSIGPVIRPAQAQASINSLMRVAQSQALIVPYDGLLAIPFDTNATTYANAYANRVAFYSETGPNKPYYGTSGSGGPPPTGYPGGAESTWGIMWIANFVADETGTWWFKSQHDDWGNITIITAPSTPTTIFNQTGWGTHEGSITLTEGVSYRIFAGFSNGTGTGYGYFWYKRPSEANYHYLTDNGSPFIANASAQPKSAQANSWTVYRDPNTQAYVWPKFGQANAKIILSDRRGFAQTQGLIGVPTRYAQAVAVIASGRYPSAVMEDDPYAYYRLIETGSTSPDVIRTGSYATYGSTVTKGNAGPLRYINNDDTKSAYFSTGTSSNDSIITTVGSTAISNTFSFEVWAKVDGATTIQILTESTSGTLMSTTSQRYLWYPTNSGSNAGVGVSVGTNGIQVAEHGTAYMPAVASYSGSLGNTWHHIVVVYSSKIAKIYLDGVLVRTGLTSTKTTAYAPVILGYGGYTGFKGYVAEAALYNYALTVDEINAHYQAGIGGVYGQAETFIWIPKAYGQAQAFISSSLNTYEAVAQAEVSIKTTTNIHGQALAHILGISCKIAQALARITQANIIDGEIAYSDLYGAGYPLNPTLSTDENVYTSSYYDSGAGGRRDLDWNFNLARPYWVKRITVRYKWRYDGIHEDPVTAARTTLIINGTSYPATSNVQPSDWYGWEWPTSDMTSTFDLGSPVRTGKITLYYTDQEGLHYQHGAALYEIAIWDEMPTEPPSVQGNAQAFIIYGIRVRGFAQATARIYAFGTKQYGLARVFINRTYEAHGQALAHIGWLRLGQAQVSVIGVYARIGQSQAYLRAFDVPRHAQSQAFLSKSFAAYANTSVYVKQTYPLFHLTPNYALTSLGATATADPDGFTIEGTPSNVLDDNPYTYWTSMVVIGEEEDERVYLYIDLGESRTISAYSILPTKYNATVELQYRISPFYTYWTTVATVYFPLAISDPIEVSDTIYGQLDEVISSRYWRLKVTNGGNDDKISICSIGLGGYSIVNPTFAQAQAILGHFVVGQAQAHVSPGLGSQYGQSLGSIKQIYEGYSQVQADIIPPHGSGNAQAQIIRVYQVYAYTGAYLIPPTYFGQSLGTIAAYNTPHYGLSKTSIVRPYEKIGQAQASISKLWSMGQANVAIWKRLSKVSNALVFIGHFQYGLALALITAGNVGQAQSWIKITSEKHGQAEVFIRRLEGYALTKTQILTKYSRCAQAATILNQYMRTANAGALIKQTYNKYAQATFWIEATYNGLAQALTSVYWEMPWSGNAQVFIVIQHNASAQAAVQIGSFWSAQAQAQIISFNVPKAGMAGCYILVDITLPIGPTSDRASYLVMYNGQKLPGYATSESIESVLNIIGWQHAYNDPQGFIITTNSIYQTATFSDYNGLENRNISLNMKVWEPSYQECKVRIQEAATILRSVRGKYGKLYLQKYDRYYLVKPKSLSMEQDATQSNKLVDYEITFESQPWVISNQTYSISTTGDSVETSGRTLADGGWTPTVIYTSGTDISIAGITEYGQTTGSVTISGTVTDFMIDTYNFITDDNTIVTPKDFGVYVGPGVTTFTISGATSTRIEWQNRWYL